MGDAQLSCHDNDDPTSAKAKRILRDAELSYRASIEQEGSPSVGGEASAKLTEQQWFKERKAKQEAEKKEAASASSQKAAAAPAAKGASPAGRGSAPAARSRETLICILQVQCGRALQIHRIHDVIRLCGVANCLYLPVKCSAAQTLPSLSSFVKFLISYFPGRGAAVRGRGNTTPSRGAVTTAAKVPAGGARGKTSPTKTAGAPGRSAARGGSAKAGSKAAGIV